MKTEVKNRKFFIATYIDKNGAGIKCYVETIVVYVGMFYSVIGKMNMSIFYKICIYQTCHNLRQVFLFFRKEFH